MQTTSLKYEARQSLMEDISRMLKSGTRASLRRFAETLKDIEATDLEALFATALEKATLDANAFGARVNAVYLAALVRDVKYTYSGRTYLFNLGAHQSFRSAYEGGRVAVDAGNLA